MSPHRIFVPSDQILDDRVTIEGSDVHHIGDVLRLKAGDSLEVRDDRQRVYATVIAAVQKDRVTCRIEGSRNIKSEPSIQITLAQGIPKGKKFDAIIRQTTELGVHAIIPVMTERSVPRFSEGNNEEKHTRWKKIAKSAAEQSGRLAIPTIRKVAKLPEVIGEASQYSIAILLSELESEVTLKSLLENHPPLESAMILVGPEGGFSQAEITQAIQAGFQAVTLGRRILRAETAPIAVLAMILYEKDL